ncbi:MAG: AI-2E family transporter [Tenericutes bacterium]|nr:AI-2E family transporter [Mycoplasmatota bacterium]
MLIKKDKTEKIDAKNVNAVLLLSKKILKIMYTLLIILAFYVAIIVFKELKVKATLLVILKILTPLFIGVVVAWLFDPFVKKLKKKGIRRSFGAIIIYVIFLLLLAIIIGSIIPILIKQMNEFAASLPSIFDSMKIWINDLFDKLNNIEGIDAIAMKEEVFRKIETIGVSVTSSLPEMLLNGVKTFFSGIGTFIVGLIIGFYLLVSFDNANELLITWLPKKMQNDTRDLLNEVNTSLRKFIRGAFYDCGLVFVVTSLGFIIVGLKSPLLFGLFCGITNVIPYAGPYIGGAPAVIVGFTQGPVTGILTLLTIVVVQFLEGNLLQPVIMSKTTKLHPVTIMLGLLIFGHFFGIIGMVLSTPIIAACKTVALYFIEKYELLSYQR